MSWSENGQKFLDKVCQEIFKDPPTVGTIVEDEDGLCWMYDVDGKFIGWCSAKVRKHFVFLSRNKSPESAPSD